MAIPNIQIEVISIDANTVQAAFYYAVPVGIQLTSATDATRAQFGTRLDAPSLTALQAGTVFGEVINRTVKGMTPSQIASLLQTEYSVFATQAVADYTGKYTNRQYAGKAFDGTTWS